MTDHDQLLETLARRTWPDRTALWREAALDILTQLEEECLRRLDQAWDDAFPDRQTIEFWTVTAARCHFERQRLRPEDVVGVACAYGLLLSEARRL